MLGRILLSSSLVAGLLIAGCAPQRSLVGTWSGDGGMMPGGSITYTFTQQGQAEMVVAGNIPPSNHRMEIRAKGTYEFQGDKVTIKTTSVDTQNLPEEVAASVKGQIEGSLKQPQTGTVQWVSDREVTINFGGEAGAIVLVRDGTAPNAEPSAAQ